MAKKQTPQAVHKLRYHYVCEHCGQSSGWRDASISGGSEADIMQNKLPKAQNEADRGSYFDLSGISGKCKSCSRRQSWELNEAKTWMKRAPMIGMGLASMGGVALAFLFGLLGFAVVFALGMVIGFICGLIMYIRVKLDVSKTENRFRPEINWMPGPSDALPGGQNGSRQLQHAPLAGARVLGAPCDLSITREDEPAGAPCGVYLNGQYAGMLSGGESVRCTTALVQNIAVTRDESGAEAAIYFAVPSGGAARIALGHGRFMPEKCDGIVQLSEADVLALPQAAPGQAFGSFRPATYAPPGSGYAAPPEKPAWAVWTLCAALLFMLLNAFAFTPRTAASYDQTAELVSLCLPLLIAACICLMARSEAGYKALSAGGLVVGAAIYAFTGRYLLVYANALEAPPVGWLLRDPAFTASLRQTLIITVAACIIALTVSALNNGTARKKIVLSAWIAAAVLFAVRIYYSRFNFTRPDLIPVRKLGLIVRFAEAGVCIALLALLIYALCAPKRRELVTGTGAKIWLCVCMLATAGVLIGGIAAKTMGIASVMTALTAVTGCILLLMSKRAGFQLMLIAVIMNVASGVSAGLTGYRPSVFNALIPLAGLLNPLITWLIIRGRWNDTPNQAFIK